MELSSEKTRIIPFGRFKGDDDDFDFLGFTFYNTKTLSGKYRIGVRTSKKKLKAKRQACREWLRKRLLKPIAETMEKLAAVLRGHYNYYGVSGNIKKITNFWLYVKESCFKMFNRRSQKRSMKSETYQRIWNYYIPNPKITVNIWGAIPKLV